MKTPAQLFTPNPIRHPLVLTMAAALMVCGPCLVDASATPPARTRVVARGLASPIAIANAPGDAANIYVCEREGVIRVIDKDTGESPHALTGFLDISALVSTEFDNGLLGLAFDPDYATNGYFYVNYNGLDGRIVLARYFVPPAPLDPPPTSPRAFVADQLSATIIWRYPRPLGHNGGWIGFSPINNYLYITSGDGGSGGTLDFANNAQTVVNKLLGKILRIDIRSDDFPTDPERNYAIPPANPFVGLVGDDEIWAYGVRSPWRASFDRANGDFYFGDVGMEDWEEINFEPANSAGGRNYGWPCMEGSHCTISTQCVCNDPSLTLPMHDYPHTTGRAVTGGHVYRGSAIPEFEGLYFFTDFILPRVWSFRPDGLGGFTEFTDRAVEFITAGTTARPRFIASFGEDADGELYMADIFGGRILKVVPYPCQPVVDLEPQPVSSPAGLTVTLTTLGAGQDPLTFRWRKDGVPIVDDLRVQGAETTVLTITDAVEADSGQYDVVLTSPCGVATSGEVGVIVYVCRSADINSSGDLSVQDIFDYLTLYFANAPLPNTGDFNQSGEITVQDIFDFLSAYFSGCL